MQTQRPGFTEVVLNRRGFLVIGLFPWKLEEQGLWFVILIKHSVTVTANHLAIQ